MIESAAFFQLLNDYGIRHFCGVPDSLLKNFCAYVADHTTNEQHIIAANEGNAAAIAAGRYLASGETSLVYMQNSGLGNLVNPAVSLLDPQVYSIPVLMLIGWRGRPGVKDEPQHVKQGQITLGLLDVLGIRYEVLPDTIEDAAVIVQEAVRSMQEKSAPFALVVKEDTFAPYRLQNTMKTGYPCSREEAIKIIASTLNPQDAIVSTTGKTSRELYEYRLEAGQARARDFLTVGSMGHASQIALGLALAKPDTQVFCLDGDGALIMHMGALAVIAEQAPKNLKHIVLNNGAHDSVGGQPTCGFMIDIPAIAAACGYKAVFRAESAEQIAARTADLQNSRGPALLEIRVNKGARQDLGRPKTTPHENKAALMQLLSGKE